MEKEFKDNVKSRGKGPELSWTIDEINQEKKTATDAAALVNSMLASARKTLQK